MWCSERLCCNKLCCIVQKCQLRFYWYSVRLTAKEANLTDSVLSGSEGLNHAEWLAIFIVAASVGVLSEGHEHDGLGVCLGDGQMEIEGVPSQGGRGDALLRRMPPYLT